MTHEEKQLLTKDLCGRLPYDVIVLEDTDQTFDGGSIGVLTDIRKYNGNKYPKLKGQYLLFTEHSLTPVTIEEVRPYLRPMSSMTEEEKEDFGVPFTTEGLVTLADTVECMDWLNSHHFDYRGLIPMGLALEAWKDMYKTE